jgi:glycosyltransferase involved in cell wall biosynthesis
MLTPHVVHVAQPTTEGVARCVAQLARHQVAQGSRVTVVCPDQGWLAAEAQAAGATHVSWTAGRSPGPATVTETARLRGIIQSLRPDLVHLHSAKAGLAGRLALRSSTRTVYQPHAWSFLAVEGLMRSLTLAWERWSVRWTDAVVCVSEAECRDAVELGLRLQDRVRVVPNGVDTERFLPRDRDEARARLGLDEGPLAVCVGRLSRQKGQDVLLDAWSAIREAVPGARLALVGDGPEGDRLRERAGEDVLFAGISDDPRDWYAAATVVVIPSRWEGMALVTLEAAASERSVVMSDVAGAWEVVPPPAGEVVPVEDPGALAAAVSTRLRDPARADREGVHGRDHVVSHYGLDVSGRKMQAVYDDLLRAR